MPPRRSCFPRGPASRGGGPASFQCHHGVPAFADAPEVPEIPQSGFNATTAFLLSGKTTPTFSLKSPFQCHHGVPAFVDPPQGPRAGRPFQCHHGVPAFGS